MLTAITSHNAHLFEGELDQMFRLRYKVLVEGEGWSELDSADGRERDEFDDDFTTYLIAQNPLSGAVAGCVRFTPSLRPSLSSEVFPQLFDLKSLPIGKEVYDGSRIVVDPDLKHSGSPTEIAGELYCGMFEFGIALQLRAITCVVAMKWLHYMRHWEWDIAPLGLPKKMGEESVLGLELHTTPEMLTHIRKIRSQDAPVLSWSDIGLIRANHEIMHAMMLNEQKVA